MQKWACWSEGRLKRGATPQVRQVPPQTGAKAAGQKHCGNRAAFISQQVQDQGAGAWLWLCTVQGHEAAGHRHTRAGGAGSRVEQSRAGGGGLPGESLLQPPQALAGGLHVPQEPGDLLVLRLAQLHAAAAQQLPRPQLGRPVQHQLQQQQQGAAVGSSAALRRRRPGGRRKRRRGLSRSQPRSRAPMRRAAAAPPRRLGRGREPRRAGRSPLPFPLGRRRPGRGPSSARALLFTPDTRPRSCRLARCPGWACAFCGGSADLCHRLFQDSRLVTPSSWAKPR